MTIFLIGYMGSGKSTIGNQLSKVLKFDFVDLDAYIEEKEGMSISELFQSKGEIYFRKIENRYLEDIVRLEYTVVSLGGGTPCYGNNMKMITATTNVKSIYLKSSIPTLIERLKQEKYNRPMISHLKTEEELTEFIGKHLFERTQFYNQSDLTLVIDKKSINEIVGELVMQLF
ncbi:MAG: shikimate kinase [Aquaticitalea sp.]